MIELCTFPDKLGGMETKTCENCGAEFAKARNASRARWAERTVQRVDGQRTRFCSLKCYGLSRRTVMDDNRLENLELRSGQHGRGASRSRRSTWPVNLVPATYTFT